MMHSEINEFLSEFDGYGEASTIVSYKPIACPKWSPWGTPDACYQPMAGIWSISTPRHGGFYVSAERRRHMPVSWLVMSFNGQGKEGWFEEDVDWCLIALSFPDEWKEWRGEQGDADLEAARRTFDQWVKQRAK